MYFLGIDMGTSYFKAGLFDEKGLLTGLGRQPVPQKTNGQIYELTVDDFWKTLRNTVQQAISGIDSSRIKAVSYSS